MDNITALRTQLKKHNIDGLLIPRTDEYQSEYLAPYAERLAWLTGFTGSAGLAVITQDQAVMFVDGRYTLQVKQQTDNTIFDYQSLKDDIIENWLANNIKQGSQIAYDPALHTRKKLRMLAEGCSRANAKLVAVAENFIDQCWQDQPEKPQSQAVAHSPHYAGESSASKCQRLAKQLADDKIDALIVNMPEDVSWLLNMRGSDVRLIPQVLSKAILYADSRVDWCFEANRIAFDLKKHCGKQVHLISDADFETRLQNLARESASIMIDDNTLPEKYYCLLESNEERLRTGHPVAHAKACKNATEVDNAHNAHLRDAVTWVNLLIWIENAMQEEQTITELCVSDKLQSFRKQQKTFYGSSFDSAASFGENGAVIHYAPSEKTNLALQKNNLFLLDAGAQYFEGTTDITRTIALCEPTQEQKQRFTQVLQGHISLASCCFPEGTTGIQLDAFARRALWDAGLDYAHGTGHGVGSFLSVHEGPQSISAKPINVALKPGMIMSNEPGFYKDGEYGIRIENLVVVKQSDNFPGFLCFENLTMVPIDLRLVDVSMLSNKELDWLNNYHHQVFEKVAPLLTNSQTRQWLQVATRPATR